MQNSLLGDLEFRNATAVDLPEIVRLLSEDDLGSKRERFENPLPQSYYQAFEAIDRDPNTDLIVALYKNEIVGTSQLTYIMNLTYQGGLVLLVESVRTDARYRGKGFGSAMMNFIIDQAKMKNCLRVQLTTNKQRDRAQKFYKTLGFVDSHVGMKLFLG